METWKEKFGNEKANVIFGTVESKDVSGVLRILRPIVGSLIFSPVKSQRGLSREAIHAAATKAGFGDRVVESEIELIDAISDLKSQPGLGLIAGSLFLAGEALSILDASSDFQISEQ